MTSELNYNENEQGIFVPNEIFEDISKHVPSFVGASAVYSFYYLYSYLWRYAKYGKTEINVKKIKKFLAFNENNKKVDYIIKKDGILDKMRYTEPTFDFPISYELTYDEQLKFYMMSEMVADAPEMKSDIRTKQKFPIKGYYRDETREEMDGTFFVTCNTHMIHPSIFITCMSNYRHLGTSAFFIYGKIKSVNWGGDDGLGEWYISREQFAQKLNTTMNTLHKYTDALESFGLIHITHRDYKDNPQKLANGYRTIEKVKIY